MKHALLAGLVFLGVGAAAADEVRLKDGKTLYGTVREEGDRIVVRLESGGTVTLKRSEVESVLPGVSSQAGPGVLYMGVSPYRDVHSRNRAYSRYRNYGGRWYGSRYFAVGHHHHGGHHGHH